MQSMNPVFMTIVFPAYNEELRIKNALLETANFVKETKGNFEVIVVENGSTDDTYNIALDTALEIVREQDIYNLVIRVEKSNPGKGSALREGMRLSTGRHVLLTDVDLSTPLGEVYRLLANNIDGTADLSIASRKHPASVVVGRSASRKYIGSAFGGLTSLLTPGIRDTQCGFKLINRDALEMVLPLLTIDGFAFDVELIFVAQRLGYAVKEIPVYWKHDPRSTVKMIPDTFKMARDVLKIAYNYTTGKYRV